MSGKVGSITTGIITDGLVFNVDAANRACYPKTGTTATDTTHNNIGTLSSTTFESTNNGVFNFDGVDDHITYPTDLDNINRPGVTNQITLEAWTYTITFNNDYEKFISRRYPGSTPLPYLLGFNTVSLNKYEFYLSGTDTYGSALFSSTDVTLNEWVHVAGTSDNTTRKIYLNGQLDNSAAYSSGIYSTNIGLEIGAQLNNQYNYNGKLGSVRIYDRALSASEILHNYNALKGRFI
jgi:hypothetical protein